MWDLLRVMRGEKRVSERWLKEEEEIKSKKEKNIIKDEVGKT